MPNMTATEAQLLREYQQQQVDHMKYQADLYKQQMSQALASWQAQYNLAVIGKQPNYTNILRSSFKVSSIKKVKKPVNRVNILEKLLNL